MREDVTRLEFVPGPEGATTLRLYRPVQGEWEVSKWEVSTWTRAEGTATVRDAPSNSFYLDKEKVLSKEEQARADKEFFDSVYDCDWFDCTHDPEPPEGS